MKHQVWTTAEQTPHRTSAAEIPSNLMMKRVRPSVWITFIMVCWSACMVGQGFVKSYAGLMVTRVLLGLFEGGLFPGVNYYITQYYRRDECGIRMATFFSAATLAGAFGGILARGIAELSGAGGLAAWSWIFILEGLASLVVSFSAYWGIHDYPRGNPRFLSPAEREEVQRRLREDSGGLAEEVKAKYVLQALCDWKIWVHMAIFLAGFCPIYSLALFSPTIIKAMGYTANSAQLMSVPPCKQLVLLLLLTIEPPPVLLHSSSFFLLPTAKSPRYYANPHTTTPDVCACIFTVGASYFADRVRQRGATLLAFQLVALAGFALLAGTRSTSAQYGGLVLAAVGIYPQVPLSMAWNSGNIGGSAKRAVGIAMQVMGGNCGGIVASYVYLAADGPRYVKGHSILIGFTG